MLQTLSGPIQRTAYSLTLIFYVGAQTMAADLGPKFRGTVPDAFGALSAACKKQFVRAGVLHKNGKPAGHQLLNKPVLRVALVEAGNDGEYPKGALTPEIKNYYVAPKPKPEEDNFIGLKAYRFSPEELKEVERGLKYWGYQKIKFVGLNDKPDVKIFAYAKPDDEGAEAGFASLPANDTIFTTPLSTPVLFLNVTPSGLKTSLPITTAHEFGHNLGIQHPGNAVQRMVKGDCEHNVFAIHNSGLLAAFPPFWVKVNFGLMAFDNGLTHNQTFYERTARIYIRSNGTDFGAGLDPAHHNVP